MKGLRILADANMPGAKAVFGTYGQVRLAEGRGLRRGDLADVDVLLVRSVTRVDGELLRDTPV
ncbi:MAG: 4-phosphoerythronate dehydrogenase, partial [Parahaliea sp.]